MMLLTDSELLQASDRAIDRALQCAHADDHRTDGRRRYRLYNVIRFFLNQLEQNLADNGQGVIRFNVDVIFGDAGAEPLLRVKFQRRSPEAQAR